jgi:hypothetical protein
MLTTKTLTLDGIMNVIEAIRIFDAAKGSAVHFDSSDGDHPEEMFSVDDVIVVDSAQVAKLHELGWQMAIDGVWFFTGDAPSQ